MGAYHDKRNGYFSCIMYSPPEGERREIVKESLWFKVEPQTEAKTILLSQYQALVASSSPTYFKIELFPEILT